MEDKEIEKLIAICRDRGEIDFLYKLTKLFADVDGVGSILNGDPESSCYDEYDFNNAEKQNDGYYDKYLQYGSIYFYELHLKQIGAL